MVELIIALCLHPIECRFTKAHGGVVIARKARYSQYKASYHLIRKNKLHDCVVDGTAPAKKVRPSLICNGKAAIDKAGG